MIETPFDGILLNNVSYIEVYDYEMIHYFCEQNGIVYNISELFHIIIQILN